MKSSPPWLRLGVDDALEEDPGRLLDGVALDLGDELGRARRLRSQLQGAGVLQTLEIQKAELFTFNGESDMCSILGDKMNRTRRRGAKSCKIAK